MEPIEPTRISNSYKIDSIEPNSKNISIAGTNGDKNFNHSIKNTLLSRMGRAGCSSNMGVTLENVLISNFGKIVCFP
jgi:hypothetical protein